MPTELGGMRDGCGRLVRKLPLYVRPLPRNLCATRELPSLIPATTMSIPAEVARPDVRRDDRELLFPGPGEMKGRCRTFDWASNALGPVEQWPQSLRTIVGSLLDSRFPNIVLWGPDLIQIYNDGYREVMGSKHPAGLGMRTRECWPEAWGFNAPIYEKVFAGQSEFFEDVLIPISRYGTLEDTYFTISYSPLRDETHAVAGVLVTLLETTARVAAKRLEGERERLLRQVELERNRLDDIFRQSPGFFAVLRGPDFIFERANEAYYQLIGYRDVIGKPVAEALPEVVEQGFIGLLSAVMNTGDPFIGQEVPVMLARTPDAEPEQVFVNFVYEALHDQDGKFAGIVAQGTEVTTLVAARRLTEKLLSDSEKTREELEQLNCQLRDTTDELEAQAAEMEVQTEELAEQTRQAQEANKAKSEFLATMSHELRTPLNAIAGYADLLLSNVRGEMTEPQRLDVERMQRSGQHLLGLINTLLNFTKIDSGEIEYDIKPWTLQEMLHDLPDLIAPQIGAKSLHLNVELCNVETRVLGDDDKVRQILLNLLTNALKFTDEGGTVTLSCESDESTARIRVRDTGRGVAAENHQRIFNPFVQLDRHLTPQKQQGIGLGLAISRDLARAMNGDLSMTSQLGKGSTFTLSLPRA